MTRTGENPVDDMAHKPWHLSRSLRCRSAQARPPTYGHGTRGGGRAAWRASAGIDVVRRVESREEGIGVARVQSATAPCEHATSDL